jgi:hypothetical protein
VVEVHKVLKDLKDHQVEYKGHKEYKEQQGLKESKE